VHFTDYHISLPQLGRQLTVPAYTSPNHNVVRSVYAYVLFFYTYALPLLGSGPLWAQSIGADNVCQRTWWTNLLYLNNLLGEDGETGTAGCMGWSWYLANDMQFFAASALLLPWYPSRPRLVLALFGMSVLASAVRCCVIVMLWCGV
jgi:peptidoglycan/LPS O-acetylase OafA/YrhL